MVNSTRGKRDFRFVYPTPSPQIFSAQGAWTQSEEYDFLKRAGLEFRHFLQSDSPELQVSRKQLNQSWLEWAWIHA